MITAEYAAAEARKQAVRSAREHQRPLAIWLGDLESPNFTGQIPYLGHRQNIKAAFGPPSWKQVSVQNYLEYPYDWFFVDSSGFGDENEPALTMTGFKRHIEQLLVVARARGEEVGLGIVEAGQFQVHVAVYRRILDRKLQAAFKKLRPISSTTMTATRQRQV